MGIPGIAEGVSPQVSSLLESLFSYGSSEAYALADCLNTVAGNGGEMCEDEFLLGVAEELQEQITYIIGTLRRLTGKNDEGGNIT